MYIHALMYSQFTEVVVDKSCHQTQLCLLHNCFINNSTYKSIYIICAIGSIQIRFIPTYWTGDFNPLYKGAHDVALKHASPDTDSVVIVGYCIYIMGRYSMHAQCMHIYTVCRVILMLLHIHWLCSLKKKKLEICF